MQTWILYSNLLPTKQTLQTYYPLCRPDFHYATLLPTYYVDLLEVLQATKGYYLTKGSSARTTTIILLGPLGSTTRGQKMNRQEWNRLLRFKFVIWSNQADIDIEIPKKD